MNQYEEMKARHEATFSEWTAGKLFFAFNQQQFNDGMRGLGLDPETDLNKIYRGPAGSFYRKDKAGEFKSMFEAFEKEQADAIEADQTGEGFIYEMFLTELLNHEYCYTGRINDALDALGVDPAELDTNTALSHGLALAMQEAGKSEV